MRASFAILLLISSAIPMFGHEYWFEPESFFLKPGQSTALRLYLGEGLKKEEERPYQASKTTSFQMFSPAGTFDMRTMADDEISPILNFSSDRQGTYLFAMERDWSYIVLEPEKFDDYLREDGMEYISAERARLGESKKQGRERYSRFIKTLLQVGRAHSGAVTRRISTKLEIVPLDNPYSKKVGDTVSFQIWFDRRPLSEKTIFADNRDGDKVVSQKLMTDTNGKVRIKLDRSGIWLVRLVYMQRCARMCGEADWESFWGALSFGVK